MAEKNICRKLVHINCSYDKKNQVFRCCQRRITLTVKKLSITRMICLVIQTRLKSADIIITYISTYAAKKLYFVF